MGIYDEELTSAKHLLFDLSDCSKRFGELRWNTDHTRKIRSPRLAEIGKSPDFHQLILLCSEHSPSVLEPVLQIALSKCTESEQQMKELKASKKREAETQNGPDSYKHARLPQSRRNVFRVGSKHDPQADEGEKPEPRFYQKDLVIDASPAVTESHDDYSINGSNSMSPDIASCASEPSVPSKTIEVCQSREDTVGEPCMPNFGPGRVSAQLLQEISQTNTAKSKAPTAYEMELGLVRGEEETQKLIMDKCMPLSPSHRAYRWFSKENELQVLFHVCRKLPLRIVKAWLLRELKSRIEVPGNRTEIPSTANMSNPSDILDALQCIKMTTINSKIHRAYGQMRLFESVEGDVKSGKVRNDSLKHGASLQRAILRKAAVRAAGNVSQKERRDRENHFYYEHDAGEKWLDVCDWFGGPGIVLIFVIAGVSTRKLVASVPILG